MAKSISDFTTLLATASVAKQYIRFHYTFSHGGLWLKSISDFSILFSHGSISDFSILFSHDNLCHAIPKLMWCLMSISIFVYFGVLIRISYFGVS